MTLNFSKVCRLCMLEEDKLLPLFNRDENLPQRVMSLVPVLKLFVGDGLPAQVCSHCVHQVNTSYNFKLQCEATDMMLKQLLPQQVVSRNTNDRHCKMKAMKEVEGTELALDNNKIRLESSSNEQGPSKSDVHIDFHFAECDKTKKMVK